MSLTCGVYLTKQEVQGRWYTKPTEPTAHSKGGKMTGIHKASIKLSKILAKAQEGSRITDAKPTQKSRARVSKT
jgi:hypothetical protein